VAATGRWRAFELPYLLQPLLPVQHAVTVISGLAIDGGRPHQDGAGDHARAASSFLTCAHPKKTGGADLRVGISVDQLLASAVGGATTFPSLELGMERGAAAGICDSGYSCAYSNNVAWKTASTPVAKETEPRAVFARLFGDPRQAVDAAQAARVRALTGSVLDSVQADAKALQGRLGARPWQAGRLPDGGARTRAAPAQARRTARHTAVPAGLFDALAFPQKLDLMYELLVMAFARDRTRVATFMLGNAGSNRSYAFLGVPEGHHDSSHHGGNRRSWRRSARSTASTRALRGVPRPAAGAWRRRRRSAAAVVDRLRLRHRRRRIATTTTTCRCCCAAAVAGRWPAAGTCACKRRRRWRTCTWR